MDTAERLKLAAQALADDAAAAVLAWPDPDMAAWMANAILDGTAVHRCWATSKDGWIDATFSDGEYTIVLFRRHIDDYIRPDGTPGHGPGLRLVKTGQLETPARRVHAVG